MKRVAVYTANFGAKDTVPEIIREPNVDYYCFTDNENFTGEGWEIIKMLPVLGHRKMARWLKANSHILFREYDYTIWVDGRIKLDTPVKNFIGLLGDNHIATSRHRKRDCVYDEGDACIKFKLGNEEVITNQLKEIRKKGYPEHAGLSETGVLVRDNSEFIVEFNGIWNMFLMTHSIRDQLSFNYILWKMEQRWSVIPKEYLNLGSHINAN
jgi:hypothetical protein